MVTIRNEFPSADDVVALLAAHTRFANEHSAPDDVHALDLDGLRKPEVSFFTGRRDDELVVVGAIKRLSEDHFELKSIHTAETARGKGAGRIMVEHLLAEATAAGARRVSLETGSMPAMTPARTLYGSLGFVECPPFADYWETESSVCMTLEIEAHESADVAARRP